MSSSSPSGDRRALNHDDVHVEIISRAMTRITHQRVNQAKVDPRVNNPMTPCSPHMLGFRRADPPVALLGPHECGFCFFRLTLRLDGRQPCERCRWFSQVLPGLISRIGYVPHTLQIWFSALCCSPMVRRWIPSNCGFCLRLSAPVYGLSSSSRGRWTSTVNCPYGGTVPVQKAHIATCLGANTGCVVSNVFEVWNWSQMLNKAVGTSRLSMCVCKRKRRERGKEREREVSCNSCIQRCDISQPCCLLRWCHFITHRDTDKHTHIYIWQGAHAQ